MNLTTQVKLLNLIPAGVRKDNAAFVANVFDKQADLPNDAKGILVVFQLGATDKLMAALILKSSDTKTNGTTLGGTPVTVHDFATKPTADDDDGIYAVYVPMEKITERYFQLQATAGNGTAGTYASAIGIVDRPGVAAPTAASLGATVLEFAA